MTSVNWAGLKKQADDATKLIPDGPQPVEVVTAEAKLSKAGNPQIKLKVRVCDGPFTGRVLITQVTVSDSGFGLAMFFQSMEGLGVTADVLAAGPSLEQVAAALPGRRAIAELDHSTFAGTERNGVKNFKTDPTAIQGAVVIGASLGGDGGGAVSVSTGMPSGVLSAVPAATNIGAAVAGVPGGPTSVVPTVTSPAGPPPAF